jgi:hypothetical protein
MNLPKGFIRKALPRFAIKPAIDPYLCWEFLRLSNQINKIMNIEYHEKAFMFALQDLKGTEHAMSKASLICAAPDLLAACKAALALMQEPDADEHFDAIKLEYMLEDAIAKAEGGVA